MRVQLSITASTTTPGHLAKAKELGAVRLEMVQRGVEVVHVAVGYACVEARSSVAVSPV